MTTSPPAAAGPNPAATVIGSEEKRIRGAIRFGSVLLAAAMALALCILLVAAGLLGGESRPGMLFGLVLAVLIGIPGIRLIQLARKKQPTFVAVDSTGLWLHNGEGRGLIRWDSLAALTVQWSPGSDTTPTVRSLELCPKGPVDRDESVLWVLVRDEEPLNPGLPRLRYRMAGPAGSAVDGVIEAARKHAPATLWAGELERQPGYDPGPDHEGHHARTQERTTG
ncbi:hypothetical protein ACFQVC_40965 [Streptomyces monticola]|uniref:Uncharacterized protein n=1 Tax=Streptomyces monticola TaxID=2666263 RepID=A0ABW2JXZ1_9ACTN